MNITGIELLNKIEITKTMPNDTLLLFTFGFFLVALVAFVICVITDADCSDAIAITCLVCLFAGVLSTVLSFVFPNKVPTGRYEYEVYICDDANVVQLYKDYEFVKTRGDIYIFRDPEEKENADSCCDCGKHTSKNTECTHNNASSECMKNHNHTHSKKNGCKKQHEGAIAQKNEETVTPVDNICSNCNSTLEEGDNFCPHCGNKRKKN